MASKFGESRGAHGVHMIAGSCAEMMLSRQAGIRTHMMTTQELWIWTLACGHASLLSCCQTGEASQQDNLLTKSQLVIELLLL